MKDEDEKVISIVVLRVELDEDGHTPYCPHYKGGDDSKSSSGAVSNAYRTGWDAIFGGKVPVGEA